MQNDGNGHHTKYSDEKPRNSADDNSVIITYRKMADDDMNTETKDTETDDDLDEEIYLRTLVILISSFYHAINWHLHYFLLFN